MTRRCDRNKQSSRHCRQQQMVDLSVRAFFILRYYWWWFIPDKYILHAGYGSDPFRPCSSSVFFFFFINNNTHISRSCAPICCVWSQPISKRMKFENMIRHRCHTVVGIAANRKRNGQHRYDDIYIYICIYSFHSYCFCWSIDCRFTKSHCSRFIRLDFVEIFTAPRAASYWLKQTAAAATHNQSTQTINWINFRDNMWPRVRAQQAFSGSKLRTWSV